MTAAVYLLWCGPRRHLYCGWTTDVERRLAAHRSGKGAKYTARYEDIELAAVIEMPDASAARREEARIKRLPRAAKLALVASHAPAPAG
jgi:putative endonuclease